MWETLRNTYENRKTNVGKPTKSVGNVAKKKKRREKTQDTFKENRKMWENVGLCVAFVCLFLKVFASSRASCSCSNTSVYALSVPVSISLCCLLLFLSSSIFTTDLFCLYLSFSSCSALVFVPVPVSISLCCLAPCFIMYVSISFFFLFWPRAIPIGFSYSVRGRFSACPLLCGAIWPKCEKTRASQTRRCAASPSCFTTLLTPSSTKVEKNFGFPQKGTRSTRWSQRWCLGLKRNPAPAQAFMCLFTASYIFCSVLLGTTSGASSKRQKKSHRDCPALTNQPTSSWLSKWPRHSRRRQRVKGTSHFASAALMPCLHFPPARPSMLKVMSCTSVISAPGFRVRSARYHAKSLFLISKIDRALRSWLVIALVFKASSSINLRRA